MRDKALETQLRLLTLQLDSWKKLHDLITYGLDKARPIISAEQERQFTEIRANLLQETEHVFGVLGLLGELSGRGMNVLQRGVSVRGVRELSNEEGRRLETEWNGVFTKLGGGRGNLESGPKARRGEGQIEPPPQTPGRAKRRHLLRQPPFQPSGDDLSGVRAESNYSGRG